MSLDPQLMPWLAGGGVFMTALLAFSALSGDADAKLAQRLARVGPEGVVRKINSHDRMQRVIRDSKDSGIPLLDRFVKMLPNPDKLRRRLARTGRNLSLGEYLLINLLLMVIFYLLFHTLAWAPVVSVPGGLRFGLVVAAYGGWHHGQPPHQEISRHLSRSDRHHVPRLARGPAGYGIDRRRRARDARRRSVSNFTALPMACAWARRSKPRCGK